MASDGENDGDFNWNDEKRPLEMLFWLPAHKQLPLICQSRRSGVLLTSVVALHLPESLALLSLTMDMDFMEGTDMNPSLCASLFGTGLEIQNTEERRADMRVLSSPSSVFFVTMSPHPGPFSTAFVESSVWCGSLACLPSSGHESTRSPMDETVASKMLQAGQCSL